MTRYSAPPLCAGVFVKDLTQVVVDSGAAIDKVSGHRVQLTPYDSRNCCRHPLGCGASMPCKTILTLPHRATNRIVPPIHTRPQVMTDGNKHRTTGATLMNDQSSRSHSIFTIIIEMSSMGEDGKDHITRGKLNLVDLAGECCCCGKLMTCWDNMQRRRAEVVPRFTDRLPQFARAHLAFTVLCPRSFRFRAACQDGCHWYPHEGGHQDQPVAHCTRQRHQRAG